MTGPSQLQGDLRKLSEAHKRIVHPWTDDCPCMRRLQDNEEAAK